MLSFQDEVPATMMDAHLKNVEKSSFGGKFDPYAGLSTSGIAGTDPDEEKGRDEGKLPGTAPGGTPATPGAADVEMKDVSKKDDGEFCWLAWVLLLRKPAFILGCFFLMKRKSVIF